MIQKFFTSESKTVTGAALLISLATLASRVVGIARDRVFAHTFGAGPVLDAYYAAFKIPDLVYNLLIVGALTAGFIPTFTRLLTQNSSRENAWKLTNNVINIIGFLIGVCSILGAIFASRLTTIIFPGFGTSSHELASQMTRVIFISPFILGISMVMGGILQSLRQFLLYSLAPVFYNLGIIIGAIILVPRVGPIGLAWGVVLGALLHLMVQTMGAISNGYRWRWSFRLTDPDTRQIGKLMIPRTLGLGLTQLNLIIMTSFATLLSTGSVAVYNFANNLQAVPTGIISIPFALAVFPLLASLDAKGDKETFIEKLHYTVRTILFLITPLAVIMLLLRAQIVRVVLGSGAFDWGATIATANTLAFFALGLFGQALIPLFARAFYARSNTKTPFIIGVVAELITLGAAYWLMQKYGVAGLALGGSIGVSINALLLAIYLRRDLGRLHGQETLFFINKIALSALVMGLTVQLLKTPLGLLLNLRYFWGILLHGLIAGSIGCVVYILMLRLLKVKEAGEFISGFRKQWLKFSPVKEGIDEAEL